MPYRTPFIEHATPFMAHETPRVPHERGFIAYERGPTAHDLGPPSLERGPLTQDTAPVPSELVDPAARRPWGGSGGRAPGSLQVPGGLPDSVARLFGLSLHAGAEKVPEKWSMVGNIRSTLPAMVDPFTVS